MNITGTTNALDHEYHNTTMCSGTTLGLSPSIIIILKAFMVLESTHSLCMYTHTCICIYYIIIPYTYTHIHTYIIYVCICTVQKYIINRAGRTGLADLASAGSIFQNQNPQSIFMLSLTMSLLCNVYA